MNSRCFPCSSLSYPLTSSRFSAAQSFSDISCPHSNLVVAHCDTLFYTEWVPVMLPMANTAPRTDKQIFCYVSLMKLLTNRGTTHSKTSQAASAVCTQGLCHGQRAGQEQGQAQAAVQDRGCCASDRECSAGSYWRQVIPAWKGGKSCQKGKGGKVAVCLTLREGGPTYKLLQTFIWHRGQSKTPAASNIHISSPTQCGQQPWEHDRSPGLPPSHSQTAPNLSKRYKARAQTTSCFLLCAIPSGVQDGHQNPSLHLLHLS